MSGFGLLMAISILLEANVLLENLQWKSSGKVAEKMNVDLVEEAFQKMDKNALK